MECPYSSNNRFLLKAQSASVNVTFARRQTLEDTTSVSCLLTRDDFTQLLIGFQITIFISERNENWGGSWWNEVHGCNITSYTSTEPSSDFFYEHITIINIPEKRTSGIELLYPIIGIVCILLCCAWPLYLGKVKGQRCMNCAGWMVIVNGLCLMCILFGCRLHPPPQRVFCIDDLRKKNNDDDDEDDEEDDDAVI